MSAYQLYTYRQRPDLVDAAGALEPVVINFEADSGIYVEPNVWMRHQVQSTS